MKHLCFYTLLHIDFDNKGLSINGMNGDFERQISIYIRCCEALAKSLAFFTSKDLVVLTNHKDYIERISPALKVVEIPFRLKIPRDIKFYSAHYKIDVFNYFGSRENEYAILIDSDILCVNKIPQNLINCVENNIPVFYNVTNQRYPAHGREILIGDKEILMNGESSLGLWAGGEFIGGDCAFFQQLYQGIKECQDIYFENYKSFHHQGDEMLVSVAIEELLRKGTHICDVGSFGGIGRFWSFPTRHIQNRLGSFKDNFLIHLPADKMYISRIRRVDELIRVRLFRYLAIKQRINRCKYALGRIRLMLK